MPRPPRPELMALLADVKQNPDDLTPWLVLCDWLEDRDDEAERARGEYCRLCFDKLGKKTYASDWEKGERRRHLYRTYHEAWLGPIVPLKPMVEKGLLTIQGTHGLIEHAEALQAEPELWAWVGKLKMYGGFTELVSRRMNWVVAGLYTLDIQEPMSERGLVALASLPGLRCLRVLKLRLPSLNRTQAKCLADSPYLNELRLLEIDGYNHEGRRVNRTDAVKRLVKAFGERLVLRNVITDL